MKRYLLWSATVLAALIIGYIVYVRNKKPDFTKYADVTEYMYKGKKVYYIKPRGFDMLNSVYDENWNYMGSPDGGISGKGNGKMTDFWEHAKPVDNT